MKLDSVDRFEIKAIAFYKTTGSLAPGKDRPAVSGEDYTEEQLMSKWRQWLEVHHRVIEAMFIAFEEITECYEDD